MADELDEISSTETGTGGRLRNWKSKLDLQPIVQPKPLTVRGEYKLDDRCGGASLRAKVPLDFNPRILAVEIVPSPGSGGEWVTVEGAFEGAEDQYDKVRIVDTDSGEDVTVDIEVVH